MTRSFQRIPVIDSHTGGEPTRVVLSGGPDLGGGSVADRLAVFRDRHDAFRRAVILEPRGSDVLVGALLVPPSSAACATGVIFFDNAQCLGMCGHGIMGVVVTLAHLGRIGAGAHSIETPAGIVMATLHADGSVAVENVPAWRAAKAARIAVPGFGVVTGDVAYGGNWFFIAEEYHQPLDCADLEQLTDFAWRTRLAVNAQGFPEVDHVILCHGPRNFVLCPGKAYDRSPCGTGTSARLACLAADGRLAENDLFPQESIMGSVFRGRYRWLDRAKGRIAPMISGRAFVTSEATLLIDPRDPFCFGISSPL